MNTSPAVVHALRANAYSANRIAPRLYQGAKPPTGRAWTRLSREAGGFDVLVLCAEEFQQSRQAFPGAVVIHCPLDDNSTHFHPGEQERAADAAWRAAGYVASGRRVLVTCMAGRNRSGLVTALALKHLTGWSGADCAEWVRQARTGAAALTSPVFLAALRSLP